MLTPRWLIRLTNEVHSSRGVQPSPIPAAVQTRLNIFRTLPASSPGPGVGGEYQRGVPPSFPGQGPFAGPGSGQRGKRLDREPGKARVRRDRSVLVSPCTR
jgi:hypothetical protein